MHITATQIFSAMQAIVEAPSYPLLQSYKEDFYTHDRNSLEQNWTLASRAIWVITPNGTHLNFVGHHARQAEEVDASVHSGYSQIEIYLLQSTGIKRLTKQQALDEAKKLDFKVKANEVSDALGNTVAYMTITQTGFMHKHRTCVHYEPGLAYRGSPSQLVALRNIAIQASITEVQTLFVAVERITVGDSLLTATGLVNVQGKPDDNAKFVIYNPTELENDGQGFFSTSGWSDLSNAAFVERHNVSFAHKPGSRVVTLREARFIAALHKQAVSQ